MCWASQDFLSVKEGASSSWANEEEESSYSAWACLCLKLTYWSWFRWATHLIRPVFIPIYIYKSCELGSSCCTSAARNPMRVSDLKVTKWALSIVFAIMFMGLKYVFLCYCKIVWIQRTTEHIVWMSYVTSDAVLVFFLDVDDLRSTYVDGVHLHVCIVQESEVLDIG